MDISTPNKALLLIRCFLSARVMPFTIDQYAASLRLYVTQREYGGRLLSSQLCSNNLLRFFCLGGCEAGQRHSLALRIGRGACSMYRLQRPNLYWYSAERSGLELGRIIIISLEVLMNFLA